MAEYSNHSISPRAYVPAPPEPAPPSPSPPTSSTVSRVKVLTRVNGETNLRGKMPPTRSSGQMNLRAHLEGSADKVATGLAPIVEQQVSPAVSGPQIKKGRARQLEKEANVSRAASPIRSPRNGRTSRSNNASPLSPLGRSASNASAKPLSKESVRQLKQLAPQLTACINGEEFHLSEEDKNNLATVFNQSIGNKVVNKQMQELSVAPHQTAEFQEILSVLKDFSFRTRNLGDPTETVKKLENILKNVHSQTPTPNEDKLSLGELGSMEMFLKAGKAMVLIDSSGIGKKDPSLEKLKNAFVRGDLVFEQIGQKLDKYSNYKSGDMIFTDKEKYKHFRNEKMDFQEQLQTHLLQAPLHHAAICIKSPNEEKAGQTQDKQSHVLDVYRNDEFDLRNKCVSSVYRLDPDKLLTQNDFVRGLLSEMYGQEDLSIGLQRDYQDIQASLHTKLEGQFQGIVNDTSRRQASGLAAIMTGMHSKTADPGRFNQLHQRYYKEGSDSDFQKKKMICSEFAAKTMLAGLIEEQVVLKDKMVRFLVNEKGYSEKSAKEIVDPIEIFSLPIPENERLSRVNPTRLLNLLAAEGCISRLEPQPLIKMLVKEEDLATDRREELIPATRITGFNPDETRIEEMKPVDLSQLEEVVEEFPSSPPENPTLTDKLMNLDGGATRSQFERWSKNGAHHMKIKERREDIKALKEEWREKIGKNPPTDHAVKVKKLEQTGQLKPLDGGMGGAYLLSDETGAPAYILKPSDEDILAVNNRKCKASVAGTNAAGGQRVRAGIPLYTTVQAEVLAYQIAKDLGMGHITPATDMVIFTSPKFHDISDNVQEFKDGAGLDKIGGPPDREKFCTVQEFVPNSIELMDLLSNLQKKQQTEDLTDNQHTDILSRALSQKDVEDNVLFACIIGETDGNCGNFRLQHSGVDGLGDPTYKMVKVDNALCFSEKNEEFDIYLDALPQGRKELSESGRTYLLSLTDDKVNNVIEKMQMYGRSQKAVNAFKERVDVLKQCAEIKDIKLHHLTAAVQSGKIPAKAKVVSENSPPHKSSAGSLNSGSYDAGTFVTNKKEDSDFDQGTFVTHKKEDSDFDQGTFVTHKKEDSDFDQGTFVTHKKEDSGFDQGTFVTHKNEDESSGFNPGMFFKHE